MTREQLVEKVAEAMWRFIYNEDVAPWDGKDTQYEDDREFMRDKARAAIAAIYEAMKEPDDAMVEVGSDILLDGAEWGKRPSAYDCYTTMLEASPLKEK